MKLLIKHLKKYSKWPFWRVYGDMWRRLGFIAFSAWTTLAAVTPRQFAKQDTFIHIYQSFVSCNFNVLSCIREHRTRLSTHVLASLIHVYGNYKKQTSWYNCCYMHFMKVIAQKIAHSCTIYIFLHFCHFL